MDVGFRICGLRFRVRMDLGLGLRHAHRTEARLGLSGLRFRVQDY